MTRVQIDNTDLGWAIASASKDLSCGSRSGVVMTPAPPTTLDAAALPKDHPLLRRSPGHATAYVFDVPVDYRDVGDRSVAVLEALSPDGV
jgi:hypothetical protein